MNEPESAFRLTALAVEGYKSLRKYTRIPLGNLTVLAGANSSGKSSALEPALLLKQTLDASIDPGPLLIDGPNVSYTSFSAQMLSRFGRRKNDGLLVAFEAGSEAVAVRYQQASKGRVRIASMTFSNEDGAFTIREGMSSEEVDGSLPAAVRTQGHQFANMFAKRGQKFEPDLRVTRARCFLQVLQSIEGGFSKFPLLTAGMFAQQLGSIIHVPALRYNSERLQAVLATGTTFPGQFDDYVASVIFHWQMNDKQKLARVRTDLKKLGLVERLNAVPASDVQIALNVNRTIGSHDMVELEDVGFGVSQVLPVVVALWAAKPNQIVYIEEPESHLHPRAQFGLARIFAAAIKRGVRVICETHSHMLLIGLQECLAMGELNADDVSFNWFSQTEDGHSMVESADVSQSGTFGNWPVDFAEVSLMAENRYIAAFRKRTFRKSPS